MVLIELSDARREVVEGEKRGWRGREGQSW